MSEDIGTLRGVIDLQDRTGAASKSAISNFEGIGKSVASVALGMVGAGGLTAAIATVMYGVKQLVSEQIDFQDSMARVQARTNMTSAELRAQSNDVILLAQRYGRGAGGLAKALDLVYEQGYKSGEAIQFLDTAVKASKIGNIEYSQSINVLDGIMDSFRMKSSDAGKVLDLLTKASQSSGVSLGALGNGLLTVAPIASEAGISFKELVASVITMTKQGVPMEQAVMGMKGAIGEMISPTKELARAIGMDGIKSAGDFQLALKNLIEYTGGNVDEMGKLIPSIRMLPGIMKLAAGGGSELADSMRDMSQSAGEADRRVGILEETVTTRWAKMKEVLKHPLTFIFKESREQQGSTSRLDAAMAAIEAKKGTIEDYRTAISEMEYKMATPGEGGLSSIPNQFDLDKETADRTALIKKFYAEIERLQVEHNKKVKTEAVRAAGSLTPSERGQPPQSKKDRDKEAKDKQDKADAQKAKELAREKEAADREERQRKLKLADLEMETNNAIHEARVRNFQEQIELWESEADRADKTETEKLEFTRKALGLRHELAVIEHAFAIENLKDMKEKETIAAEGNKELIAAIEKKYIAASKNIDSEWATRTEKIQKLTAEVEVKLHDGAMEKLSKEINFNFRKWKDDLKNGSTAAWQGLISDVQGSIFAIGDLFGGLPDQVKGPISAMANVFSSALSGNPLSVLTSVISLIGKVGGGFGDMFKEASVAALEAANANRAAAGQAKLAADAFLRAQGRDDYEVKSIQDIEDTIRDFDTQMSSTLTAGTNINKTAELNVPKAEAYINRLISGESADTIRAEVEAQYAAWNKTQPDKGKGKADAMMLTLLAAAKGGSAYSNLFAGRQVAEQQLAERVAAGPSYVSTLDDYKHWTGAKAFIEQQFAQGVITDATRVRLLQEYADKFFSEISPLEHQDIDAMVAPGSTAGTPTGGGVSVTGDGGGLTQGDAYGTSRIGGDMSVFDGMFSGQAGNQSVTVEVLIDPNIPITNETAQIIGDTIASRAYAAMRAGG